MMILPNPYYTTEDNVLIKTCKGVAVYSLRHREMGTKWRGGAIAGDSAQVKRLGFRSGRGRIRLTFTYIETDDMK